MLFAALWPSGARATDCSGVTSTCINDDTLWPHAGPARFVAVGSTETVAAQQLSFGLVTSYLSRPVVLHLTTPGGGSTADLDAVEDQVNATFAWAYGVTERLELDLVLPLTLGQSGLGLGAVTGGAGLRDTATRDMRFGTTFQIVKNYPVETVLGSGLAGLAARFEVSAPTGDDDQFSGERAGVFVPSLAADVRYDRFFAGAELGARLRPTTELLGARVGTQGVAALGVGAELLPREWLSVTAEAWALPTFAEQADVVLQGAQYVSMPNGHYITPAEWALSARSAPVHDGDLSFQLSGGGGIPLDSESAITVPRFRFTLGVRWAPHARPQ
ncbi:MAG: hypothetical protein ABTD50_06955 [Polyangiaceae bacterium]|jgi:hypothetical protein